MVLTVTLNPLLEKKFFFKEIGHGKNRAYKFEHASGGKGININRQLNVLGIKNHALTFLGGANGKKLRSVLEEEKISFSAVSTKYETREAALIYDEKKENLTTYFGPNSNVTISEIDEFVNKLEKAIINSSIVVFGGSLPNSASSIILEKGIEICNKHDKISILDTYGNHLQKCIELGPAILHNNLDEIKASLNINFKSDQDIITILDQFYQNRINLAFITSGKADTFASKSDFHYKIKNPQIIEKDATGSGDAFVSGIIYGLEKSLIFNDFVKFASALGAQNAASWQTCSVTFDEVNNLVDKISIEEIGKKIKIIDDSPTI